MCFLQADGSWGQDLHHHKLLANMCLQPFMQAAGLPTGVRILWPFITCGWFRQGCDLATPFSLLAASRCDCSDHAQQFMKASASNLPAERHCHYGTPANMTFKATFMSAAISLWFTLTECACSHRNGNRTYFLKHLAALPVQPTSHIRSAWWPSYT